MTIRFTGLLALVAAVLGLLIAFWDRDDDTARARLEEARRAFRFNPPAGPPVHRRENRPSSADSGPPVAPGAPISAGRFHRH